MLPRDRIETALAFRTPDKIPLQVAPSPAGLYEHGQKLLDLQCACGGDFGDPSLTTLPAQPGPEDFDPDGRYHAIRTDGWGTTWEYRIFGIWGHPISWPLNDL
jgi:uroporphyrinogen decarboxylase